MTSNLVSRLLTPGDPGDFARAGAALGGSSISNLPTPLSQFMRNPISSTQVVKNSYPISALSSQKLTDVASGLMNVGVSPEDEGLGCKKATSYRVGKISHRDRGVFQPCDVPIFSLHNGKSVENVDLLPVDTAELNYQAHLGYIEEKTRKALIQPVKGRQQLQSSKMFYYKPWDSPYNFVGLNHQNSEQVRIGSGGGGAYFQQPANRQIITNYATEPVSIYNLFGSEIKSGSLLYALEKEFDLSGEPLYDYTDGSILLSDPKRIRDTVMQLRFFATNSSGPWVSTTSSLVQSDSNQEKSTNDQAWRKEKNPTKRRKLEEPEKEDVLLKLVQEEMQFTEFDLGYESKMEKINQVYKQIEYDDISGTYHTRVITDVEDVRLGRPSTLYDEVFVHLCLTARLTPIGISAFYHRETSPDYERERLMGHYSRKHITSLNRMKIHLLNGI